MKYLILIIHFLVITSITAKKAKINLLRDAKRISKPEACVKLTPVSSEYEPKGIEIRIEDLTVYETPNKMSTRLLIAMYDIEGLHPVTKQVVDKLSESGFRVVMPDFFRGKPYNMTNFSAKDWPQLMSWIDENGNWNKSVRADLIKILRHYKNENMTAIGVIGICWGGMAALNSLKEFPEIKVGALIHPSLWKTNDANNLKKPAILLPTKDDDDMIPFFEILKKNVGQENCEHHRFGDMHHGFFSSRGDLSNQLNRRRVDEALEMMQKFFHKHLPK